MSETIYACSFARGAWDRDDWRPVQSPRWNRANDWIQEADHIRNDGPEIEDGETFTSMVLQHPVDGDVTVTATMAFDERMAPLLVVAEAPATLGDDRFEYRAHYELVLWDEGINLWDHRYADGQPSWSLAASWSLPLQPHRLYRLACTCRATHLEVDLDGRRVGTHAAGLPRPLHVGLTACEGTNRFYDFSVSRAG